MSFIDDDDRSNGWREQLAYTDEYGGLTEDECADLTLVRLGSLEGLGLEQRLDYMNFVKYLIQKRVYNEFPKGQ